MKNITLNDKWEQNAGRVYLTGSQALARLPMLQSQLDQQKGLNTAGFISGYRGSPLGGFDKTLWQARAYLERHNIYFQPGINEDLGATAVWGSQQVAVFDGAKYDGVFSLWYGKGPGVDRSGDVLKHANAFGTSAHGGVLAVAGDDHACKSSTLPHQSDYAFIDAMMPILYPSGIQEMLVFGLYGWAMSRFSGCWVGFKTLSELLDSSISADLDLTKINITTPTDVLLPETGIHARWPDKPMQQEARLHTYKLKAAEAFCRANHIDKVIITSENPRLGIVTAGKSYLDVLQALEDLGISHKLASQLGITLYKIGMVWPLEPNGIRTFAQNVPELLLVEEKRGVIEDQVRNTLYSWPDHQRPRIVGKHDDQGRELLSPLGELTPAMIARAIASRITAFYHSENMTQRLAFLDQKEAELAQPRQLIERTPHFCSGCPHNTSTQVPEGSKALGGIGCHYMATWMERGTETFTQMGGEGATWIGQAPFTTQQHVFQNLGDGTYFHSGLLAIRAAVASGTNITYKILYNDAVAMTGGQSVDGQLSVQQISHQLYGEGIRRIAIVSDEPNKYPHRADFAHGVTFHHRDELDLLQRELRDTRGCTALIFDQTCAAEKRRRRKRGQIPEPDQRVVIHSEICEGCGDCGVQSNCLSVLPKATERGRKRMIDQSACNKDFSCVRGFCPSFVTIKGGQLKKAPGLHFTPPSNGLPEPAIIQTEAPYNLLLTGVGGTGVVTVSALLGMAAHIEGKGVGVLDQIGLAQKFGAVMSHVRIAQSQQHIHTVRIPAGETDLLISFDLMVGSSEEALGKLDRQRSAAIINNHETMPAAFTRDPDLYVPNQAMQAVITATVRPNHSHCFDATTLATRLLGDSMAVNLFTIGYAWQKGLIPLQRTSIETAIRLNGASIEANLKAFLWGRCYAHDAKHIDTMLQPKTPSQPLHIVPSLMDVVQRESIHLQHYQNIQLATCYQQRVERIKHHESHITGRNQIALAVAENYARLLAYKDEYEVARLLISKQFQETLENQFDGPFTLEFNLAPPLLTRSRHNQRPKKIKFSQHTLPLFRVLAKLKGLRGTAFDIFGWQEDRRLERKLIQEYEADLTLITQCLTSDNHALALQLAQLPQTVRGFGPVKAKNYETFKTHRQHLHKQLTSSETVLSG